MASRLLELRTDLRSLKYGFDRPNEASSNQPLIETKLPAEFSANTAGNLGEQIRNGIAPAASFLQGSLDNLVRGGLLLPSRIVQDTSRLTFFLLGFKPNSPFNPTGPAFILKQNILSLMAPRTQTPSIFGRNRRGTLNEDRSEITPLPGEAPRPDREGQGGRLLNDLPYLPTSTIAQAAGNAIGLHVPKQGINPFNQFGDGPIPGRYFGATKNQKFDYDQDLPNQANRLFSLNEAHTMGYTIRYNRFGLNPGGETTRRIDKKNQIRRRRQEGLTRKEEEKRARLQTRLDDLGDNQDRRRRNLQSQIDSLTPSKIQPYEHAPHTSNFILTYPGGPNAPFGIGVTRIRFAEGQRTFGVNSGESLIWDYSDGQNIKFRTEVRVLTKKDLHDREQNEGIGIIREDFRSDLIESAGSSGENLQSSKVLSISPSYVKHNINKRLGIGDPGAHQNFKDDNGNVTRNVINAYTPLKNLKALNRINFTPVYEDKYAYAGNNTEDLIKFRIGIVSNDANTSGENYTLTGRKTQYVHFPAYLDSFTDTNSATWNEVRYVGRGDAFYNYGGFARSISLGFRVVAESKPELMIMYDKLNFLISSLAPDYSEMGYPRGNIAKMTMGDYLNEMPCVITSLNYSIPPESPFEIALNSEGLTDTDVRQLPMMITVTMTINPIHDFLVSRIKYPHRDPATQKYTTSKGFIGHIYEPGERNVQELINVPSQTGGVDEGYDPYSDG